MTYIPDDKPLTAGDLRAIIADRMSVRKNGHTWRQYFGKWLTPQNIVALVFLLAQWVFWLGGSLQRAQTNLENAVTAANGAVEVQKQVADRMAAYEHVTNGQQAAIQQLQQSSDDAKDKMVDVEARLKLTVTRGEWRQVMDGNAQIIRRLDRMEKGDR